MSGPEALRERSNRPRSDDMRVMTVLGPVDPRELGVTLTHEHLLIDRSAVGAEWDYHAFDDVDLMAEEVSYYKRAGGGSVVDATSVGLSRNPEGLVAVSDLTGVHVIMGSGWYYERVYPALVYETPTNQLADMLIQELRYGVGGTGIRPGVIGEIGTKKAFISPAAERVFRAAARASVETGIAISTHCDAGHQAAEQLALLQKEGVAPNRVIIGHQGQDQHARRELRIASSGAYVQFDVIGLFLQPERDIRIAANVATVVRAGFVRQVLISQDTCLPHQLHAFGGHGFDYLLTTFLPMLQDAGVGPEEINLMLRENPADVLAF